MTNLSPATRTTTELSRKKRNTEVGGDPRKEHLTPSPQSWAQKQSMETMGMCKDLDTAITHSS